MSPRATSPALVQPRAPQLWNIPPQALQSPAQFYFCPQPSSEIRPTVTKTLCLSVCILHFHEQQPHLQPCPGQKSGKTPNLLLSLPPTAPLPPSWVFWAQGWPGPRSPFIPAATALVQVCAIFHSGQGASYPGSATPFSHPPSLSPSEHSLLHGHN